MNSQLQKQILVGAVAGIVVAALIFLLLGGKRSDLAATQADIVQLQAAVDKGKLLKASYEKLREEVAKEDKRIDALVKIMPSEADYGEVPYRIKKLADDAGIDQTSFSLLPAKKTTYYTEKPIAFTFRVGYHTFGQFASLISGYDKIINLSNIELTRASNSHGFYPAAAKCTISVFVYNVEPPPTGPNAKAPGAAGAKAH